MNKNTNTNEWWKLIVVIICASIFSTILINLILSLDISNIFRIADSVWVGFWGSLIGAIIGACITMLGIKATIEENREIEKINKKFNIAPYLSIKSKLINIDTDDVKKTSRSNVDSYSGSSEIINLSSIDHEYVCLKIHNSKDRLFVLNYYKNSTILNDYEKDVKLYLLTVENIGLGNAVYVYIDDIFIENNDENRSKKTTYVYRKMCMCTGLVVGEKFGILLNLVFMDEDINNEIIKLKIRYNDLLGNTYIQTISIILRYYTYNDCKENVYIDIKSIEYSDGNVIEFKQPVNAF